VVIDKDVGPAAQSWLMPEGVPEPPKLHAGDGDPQLISKLCHRRSPMGALDPFIPFQATHHLRKSEVEETDESPGEDA